jgi:hypothetical protein
VSYACFDTLVRHWDLLTSGVQESNPGLWVSLIFLEGFVKPLIMGTATGIACAEFSGLGRGYDGFTPRYFRGVAEAILANIAFQAGTYLFSYVGSATLGVMLSIGWGLLILAILILRMRNVLHVGLMEAALERSARDAGIGPSDELEFCAQCEMPLLDHAAFCTACGTAVRVRPKTVRPKAPAVVASRAAIDDDRENAATSIIPGMDRDEFDDREGYPDESVNRVQSDDQTSGGSPGSLQSGLSTSEDEPRHRYGDDQEWRP